MKTGVPSGTRLTSAETSASAARTQPCEAATPSGPVVPWIAIRLPPSQPEGRFGWVADERQRAAPVRRVEVAAEGVGDREAAGRRLDPGRADRDREAALDVVRPRAARRAARRGRRRSSAFVQPAFRRFGSRRDPAELPVGAAAACVTPGPVARLPDDAEHRRRAELGPLADALDQLAAARLGADLDLVAAADPDHRIGVRRGLEGEGGLRLRRLGRGRGVDPGLVGRVALLGRVCGVVRRRRRILLRRGCRRRALGRLARRQLDRHRGLGNRRPIRSRRPTGPWRRSLPVPVRVSPAPR